MRTASGLTHRKTDTFYGGVSVLPRSLPRLLAAIHYL